jgi:hypothetical protein
MMLRDFPDHQTKQWSMQSPATPKSCAMTSKQLIPWLCIETYEEISQGFTSSVTCTALDRISLELFKVSTLAFPDRLMAINAEQYFCSARSDDKR